MTIVRRVIAAALAVLTVLVVLAAAGNDGIGPLEVILALVLLGLAAMIWPRATASRERPGERPPGAR